MRIIPADLRCGSARSAPPGVQRGLYGEVREGPHRYLAHEVDRLQHRGRGITEHHTRRSNSRRRHRRDVQHAAGRLELRTGRYELTKLDGHPLIQITWAGGVDKPSQLYYTFQGDKLLTSRAQVFLDLSQELNVGNQDPVVYGRFDGALPTPKPRPRRIAHASVIASCVVGLRHRPSPGVVASGGFTASRDHFPSRGRCRQRVFSQFDSWCSASLEPGTSLKSDPSWHRWRSGICRCEKNGTILEITTLPTANPGWNLAVLVEIAHTRAP